MEVRIGTTADGHSAGYDTASTHPLLLLGDTGRGKTTTARYIARWWLADTTRHAHVFAANLDEWADLRCHRAPLDDLGGATERDCRDGSCLVVVDDLDRATAAATEALLPGQARVIFTSHGGNPDQVLQLGSGCGSGLTSLGLVRRHPATARDATVLDGQGRLDWPSSTVAVVPDQRGPLDFPCHRWHTSPDEWEVVTR